MSGAHGEVELEAIAAAAPAAAQAAAAASTRVIDRAAVPVPNGEGWGLRAPARLCRWCGL